MHAGYEAYYTRRIETHRVSDTLAVTYVSNGAGGGVWRVEEIVTPRGHYIEWPEAFNTRESAETFARRTL